MRDDERISSPTVPATAEHAAAMHDLLEEIVACWGLDLEVSATFEGDTVSIALNGPDAGLLTDGDARTLEALQYLVSKMASRVLSDNVRVLMDAGGWRSTRDEELRRMALENAEEAVSTGRPVRLQPLNAYERRIIHLVLQEQEGVRTYSLGRGYFKRVTIEPTRMTKSSDEENAGDDSEE